MKYMVMECHPAFAVVMDEEGRFQKVANQGYQVGQTVTDVFPMEVPGKTKSRGWLHLLQGAAAVAACAVLAVTIMLNTSQVAYASVYLDMAPQIRIDMDKQARVVELSATGPDGTSLLDGYDYQGKELGQIVRELVDRAVAMDYLQAGCSVTLRLDTQDMAWVQQHRESLREELANNTDATDPNQVRVDWDDDDEDDDPEDLEDDGDDRDDNDPVADDQEDSDAEDELEHQMDYDEDDKDEDSNDSDDDEEDDFEDLKKWDDWDDEDD